MLSSAMKRAIYRFSKIDEITTHNAELQILSETVDNSDKYR